MLFSYIYINNTSLKVYLKILILLTFLVGNSVNAQFYTGSYQRFGKNRVQYKGFEWRYNHYEKFKIYYYQGGEKHAVYAAKSVHKHMKELQKYFEYYIDDELDILVFNRHSDYKMSNIGVTTDPETNIGGVTQLVGSKLFLYFDGDHRKFDEQIRSGIAEILIQKMLYGENWKDAIKASTLLSMPSWYTEGFKAYIGKGWNSIIDNQVKDGILSDRFIQFNKLEGKDAELAGHSLWNFVAEKYGAKVLPQIFYMARISRNVESGFLFVLGINLSTLSNEYINYYRARYTNDEKSQSDIPFEALPIKNKRDAVYTQYKVSPNGRYAAFVSNQLGQYKVWLYDIVEKKTKRIYKRDYKLDRIPDHSFPVLNWHPTQNALVFFTEEKAYLNMNIYTVDDDDITVNQIAEMEKVLDFDYTDDGSSIVLSGVYKGQSDIFLLKGVSRVRVQLTNDIYDDLHPRFTDDRHIIFSSNRANDTLPKEIKLEEVNPHYNDFDIFVLDIDLIRKRNVVLQQITNTPDSDEFHPDKYDKVDFTYTSDRNGIFNRYVAKYDSVISNIDTVVHYRYFSKEYALSNYKQNVNQYTVYEQSGRVSFMTYEGGKYRFYQTNRQDDKLIDEALISSTSYKLNEIKRPTASVKTDKNYQKETIKVVGADPKKEINTDHFNFEDETPEFEKEVIKLDEANNIKKEEAKIVKKEKKEAVPEFELPAYQLYKTNFTIDYLVTQFDNSFLFQSYQRYAGPGAVYFNPGLNGLVKVGVSDLFEDHKLLGGFRLPANFNSGEYLLTYDNLVGRLDHKFVAYRNTFQAVDNDFSLVKIFTHEGKYRASYPLDEVQSVRFTGSFRNDRTVTQAIDDASLDTEDTFINLVSGKLEYVFDATRPRGLNLYNGTRLKVFGEYFRELNQDQSNIYIFGADVRHYQKIHKDIIYAGRFAVSYSLGQKRLVYYLGGVDNWIFRPQESFDESVQVPQDLNFAFQSLGTPMRGFVQNIRNGTNFAVINNEIRVPVVKYFANKPIKSDFLENFQIIGFNDIGSAWTGLHPYSNSNSFNTIVIEDNIYHIELENQKDPIVYGYGFGLRSRLFGYFIRFDWAWGVDDGVTESIRYLSLSLDF